jgi:outer membrane autotransporter protein
MTFVRNQPVKASRRSVPLAALLLTGTALSCVPTAAQAQSKWNGTTSENWFDATNWTPNAVPDATTDVTIDTTTPNGTVVNTGTAAAGQLTVGDVATGNLSINSGGALSGNDAFVGQSLGSTGSITVAGAGSELFLTDNLEIGVAGAGSMAISDKALVADQSGIIGYQDTGVGIVTVDGASSGWENSVGLAVGATGNGTLHITNGGSVLSAASDIGFAGGLAGIVTVEGPGSSFIATSANNVLHVGFHGTGTIQITNGGSVQAYDAYLGYASQDPTHQSQGTVTIDGAGSIFTTQHGLYVGGYNGTAPSLGAKSGVLSITDGGELNSTGDLIVGSSQEATGTVTVSDPGSILLQTGDLLIGDNDGTGTVGFSNQAQGTVTGNIGLAITADSTGTLTIDGVHTMLTVGNLDVGFDGTGTATVSGGGALSSTFMMLGFNPGSDGTITIKDAGSSIDVTGDAIIGGGGVGMLSILGGASLNDQDSFIGSDATGTATVDGAGSTLGMSAMLAIGNNATGTLNVQNGGNVTSDAGEIGFNTSGIGTVNVTGQESAWKASTIADGDFGNGTMTVSAGGSVHASSTISIGSQAGATGMMTVTDSGSVLQGEGLLTVGLFGTGTLAIGNGGHVIDDLGEVGSQSGATGTVTVDGAGSAWDNDALSIGDAGTGTLNIRNGGAAIADTGLVAYQPSSSGTITVDGAGSILTFDNSFALGRFGNGTLTVSNGGTLKSLPGVMLGLNTGATGILNIGAGAMSAAAAPGTVNAPLIAFGDGTGIVNFNHTSQNYTFTPGLAGLGTINQIAGVTHLVADSSGFKGTTNVTGGTLLIDSNLGDANAGAGTVNVQSGASVGGKGKAGGEVIVLGGATLLGVQGQTFSMHDLSLANGALVNVTLDTPGGTALFNVTNDLLLDGMLNITSPGAFGPGVYALFTYGGVLTNNILDVGATPAGTSGLDFTVQTGVAGQVNLASTAQATLNFWDGDGAGAANNNAVDGGSGVWSATNTNWTDANGTSNGAMTPQPGFAIFQTPGGTVTVDGSAGDVAVTGMQFAADGYKVVGDAITLADPHAIIRVGDGSAAGANYVATVGSALTGSGGLDKTDLGTLILADANSYTGETRILGGTLALAGDGSIAASDTVDLEAPATLDISATNNGASVTTLLGTGTINLGTQTLTLTDGEDTFDGVIGGTGGLTMAGTDAETLTGINTYTGKTSVVSGTLGLGGTGSIAASSGVAVAQSATFDIHMATAPVSIQSLSGAGEVDLGGQVLLLTNASDQFDGMVAGTGDLFVTGGTERLTGINTYTGATAVSGGTLALRGNGSIAASSEVVMTATGIFDISGTTAGAAVVTVGGDGNVVLGAQTLTLTNASAQLTGVISGSGGLTIAAGTETLSGANTYTGLTTIGASASLELKGGSSIQGNVVDDGALLLNDATDVTLGGVISGAGGVGKSGTATVKLTGVNSYTGGTNIAQGTLVGSATSFGTGPIEVDGALVLDQPTDASFANDLGGTGSFTKQGGGVLTLTSDSSFFTGATTVASGRLSVNGSLAGSVVTLKSGANLGGNGVVGGVIAESGSIVAPGNSIGLLHVAGDYNQAAGSTYQVELNSTGQSDRIDVTGTATIANGALLAVTNTGTGTYVFGTQYKILDAADGISGTYTLAGTQLSAFMGLALVYDANDVYLDVTKTQSFASAGVTKNQIDTGAGLDSLPVGNPIVGAVVVMPDDATAQAAFDQLSGEIHASAKTAMLEDGRLVRDAAIGRLLSNEGGGTGLWGTYTGSWAKNDGNGNAATLTRNASNFVLGVDTSPANGFTLGVLGGYAKTDVRLPARNSKGRINSYTAGVYAGGAAGPLKIRLGAAYSWQNLDTSRSVAFAGFSDHLSASYSASTAQAFGDVGYTIGNDRLNLEPFAQVAWMDVATEAFTEKGGAASLKANKQSQDLGVMTLGLRGVAGFSIAGVTARFHATAGWRETSGDRTPDASLSFASGGSTFDIAGAPIAKTSAMIDTGLDVAVTPMLRLNVGYVGQFASNTRDNGVRAGISMAF